MAGRPRLKRIPTIVKNNWNVCGCNVDHWSAVTERMSSHNIKRQASDETTAVFARPLRWTIALAKVLLPAPAGPQSTINERCGRITVSCIIACATIHDTTTSRKDSL